VVHGRNRLREGSVSPHSAYRAFGTPVIYLGHDGPLVERHPEAPAPIREKKVAPGDAVSNRQCPRCHTPCLYLWCPTCALLFDCPDEKCGTPYENPLGKLCGKCGRKIEQEPWEPPVGDPVQPGPSRARDIQAPARRSSGRPTQERPGDVLRQKRIFSSPADDEADAQ
jgi:hypothetical protein